MQRRQRRGILEQQADLFEAPNNRPMWTQLPSEVRRSATELLARMLRQERRQEAARQAQVVEHE